MKVEFFEHRGCFAIDLTPETLEEGAMLVRFGMNTTTVLTYLRAYASTDGISASVVISKSKRADNAVPKRNGR